jgi:HEAT repeat protein
MADQGWLREDVPDDEVGLLFTSVGDDLHKAIANVMERAARNTSVEATLIDLLERAVEEESDDTGGAVWIALILGELGSREAIPTLVRALYSEDEPLCEAAVDALRRIGEPGFDEIMKALDRNENVEFELACYRALEGVGAWDHPYLLDEVRDFILARFTMGALPAAALEGAALTLARLGDRRALEPIRGLLRDRFQNLNASLRDAAEMLEENAEGIPLVPSMTAWEDRLAWLTRGEARRTGEKDAANGPRRRRNGRPHTAT